MTELEDGPLGFIERFNRSVPPPLMSRKNSLLTDRHIPTGGSDVIIRMNKAPTSGFEKDVGSRTTHHVMYPESAIDLDNTTSLLLIPFKTLDLQWITSALTTGSIEKIKANKNRVLVYSPTFFKYV
ncbi:hypothetical protein J4Q44_G00062110 [Coregonus suidteri]|uniref:Uncharacterized protein n=1 Tax=Coregonus suidteri TaxID=861788 RepID=A0AAN8RDZ8_9TELE